MSDDSHPKQQAPDSPRSTRLFVLISVTVIAFAGVLLLLEPGEPETLARCLILGQGRAWQPDKHEDFEADFFGMTYRGNTEEFIDMSVKNFGAYEKGELFVLRDVTKTMAGDDGVFVDVGANVGHHSLFMSLHADTVHAIEPFPPVLAEMDAMIAENEIDNIVVHRVGLSNEPGSLPFHMPSEDNMGSGSFASDAQDAELPTQELPLVTGDSLFDQQGIGKVHTMKVDIEGYERPAFEGMAATFERDRPAVLFEMNTHNELGFHSESELRGAFPDDYVFYRVDVPPDFRWRIGDGQLMCGRELGHYELVPYAMDFVDSRFNMLALPVEWNDKVARSYP